jgi:Legionella pneumophila major outer membrane protein precursor
MRKRFSAAKSLVIGLAVSSLTCAGASAEPASQLIVSAEVARACWHTDSFVHVVSSVATTKAGVDGCSPVTTIEVSRSNFYYFGILDHWAIRGRNLAFSETKPAPPYPFNLSGNERRSVVDAEIGASIPALDLFGTRTRAILGLRYADWRYTSTLEDQPGGEGWRFHSVGFGPRIGLNTRVPIGNGFFVEAEAAVASVYAKHTGDQYFGPTTILYKMQNKNQVTNVELSAALGFATSIQGVGLNIAVGYRKEDWNRQLNLDSGDARYRWLKDRDNQGPFIKASFGFF